MAAEDDPATLAPYLAWLTERTAAVFVVDGSDGDIFARNGASFPPSVRHVAPDPPGTRNGKVGGVCTGLRLARASGYDACVVADDDVRYDDAALAAMAVALTGADAVRPQNYFAPVPWHAVEDTARTLLNRAFRADYPGTLGVRCGALPAGYSGHVLFENLELIRTVRAYGGRAISAPGIYVRRVPPTARAFWDQRIRQAYDSFAQPLRMAAELAVLPSLWRAGRRPRVVLGAVLVAIAVAERGRRRAGGRAYFPTRASLCAPIWLAERAVCSWLALGARMRGGARYRQARLAVAAHSMRQLRRQAAAVRRTGLVGAVTERLDRGSTTPAQRDGAAVARHERAVGVADLEVPPQQQRSVRVRRHGRGGLCGHDEILPKRSLSGTDAVRVGTGRWSEPEET
jgi:hypothetical protein